jgi:two-component system nitrogen regulation response regulator NtrX
MLLWRKSVAMRVLIVDDEPRIRSSVEGLLREEGYVVGSCERGEKCLERVQKETFDVVLLDVVLPGMDGLEVLERLKKATPGTKVLMMSGRADISTAVRATKLGAHDFFEKPLNPDRVILALKNISDRMALERRVVSLESLVEQEEEMVGDSPPMLHLREAIFKAAPSEGRVLIYGENGTGKELVARAIHRGSDRKDRPFVSLNCAALPKDLVESELFGYEKGAFTGAVRRKPGRFETADGGSLFLDEIGDMSLDTQAKLLRVLEENEAVRLGGDTPYGFDVRIISATNKDLSREMEEGRFREDLYYRLNVVPLHVPSLRDRKQDIPLLSQYFLRRICERMGRGMKKMAGGAVDLLQSYDWPGNVRELRNFVERLVIMSGGETIDVDEVAKCLPPSQHYSGTRVEDHTEDLSLKERIERFEREVLVRKYNEAGGNVSELARRLKIDRANLHRKLRSYGIK